MGGNPDVIDVLSALVSSDDSVEKEERDLLSPCARRRYAKVRLTKLKASSSTDFLSAICRTW